MIPEYPRHLDGDVSEPPRRSVHLTALYGATGTAELDRRAMLYPEPPEDIDASLRMWGCALLFSIVSLVGLFLWAVL